MSVIGVQNDRELGINYPNTLTQCMVNHLKPESLSNFTVGQGNNSPSCAIFALNFSTDGSELAAGMGDRTIRIWDWPTGSGLRTLYGHNEIVSCIENLDRHKERLLSGSVDKTIILWRQDTPLHIFEQHQDWIRCLAVNHTESKMASGCISAKAYLWDLETYTVLSHFDANRNAYHNENFLNTVNSLNFLVHSDTLLLCGTRDGYIELYDIRDNSPLELSLKAHSEKLNLALPSCNGNTVLSSGRDSTIRLWDLRMLKVSSKCQMDCMNVFSSHSCKNYNLDACFLNGSDHIVTGSEDGNIYLYDCYSDTPPQVLNTSKSIIHILAPYPASIGDDAFLSCDIHTNQIVKWESRLVCDECDPIVSTTDDWEASITTRTLEEVMHRYADQLLRLFHNHDIDLVLESSLMELREIVSVHSEALPEFDNIMTDLTMDYEETLIQRMAEYEADTVPLSETINNVQIDQRHLERPSNSITRLQAHYYNFPTRRSTTR